MTKEETPGDRSRQVLLLTSHPLEGHDGADKELALAVLAHSIDEDFTWFGQAWPGVEKAIHIGTRRPIVSRLGTPGVVERMQVAAWALILEKRFDLIHAIFSVGGLSGAYASVRRHVLRASNRRPVIHTIPSILRPSRFRRDHVLGLPVALSMYTADLLRNAGLPDVRVIPPGIELDRWPLTPRVGSEPPSVLTVGHYGSGDGFAQALLAAAALNAMGHRLSWVFAIRRRPGQNEVTRRREIIARAASYGVDNLTIHGRVNDMREVVRSCSIVLFTPTKHYASSDLPLSILEAMATGRPVVVSDLPPFRDLRESVVRVPVGDIGVTCDAIVRLISSRDEWEQAAGIGRRRVETDFTAARMTRRYLELYDEVLL